jgi:hypothetical protein
MRSDSRSSLHKVCQTPKIPNLSIENALNRISSINKVRKSSSDVRKTPINKSSNSEISNRQSLATSRKNSDCIKESVFKIAKTGTLIELK